MIETPTETVSGKKAVAFEAEKVTELCTKYQWGAHCLPSTLLLGDIGVGEGVISEAAKVAIMFVI